MGVQKLKHQNVKFGQNSYLTDLSASLNSELANLCVQLNTFLLAFSVGRLHKSSAQSNKFSSVDSVLNSTF